MGGVKREREHTDRHLSQDYAGRIMLLWYVVKFRFCSCLLVGSDLKFVTGKEIKNKEIVRPLFSPSNKSQGTD